MRLRVTRAPGSGQTALTADVAALRVSSVAGTSVVRVVDYEHVQVPWVLPIVHVFIVGNSRVLSSPAELKVCATTTAVSNDKSVMHQTEIRDR